MGKTRAVRRATDAPFAVAVGCQIRRQREPRGLTQQMVATKCGVSSSLVSAFERGKRLPTLRILDELAKAPHCDLIELLPLDEQLPAEQLPLPDELEIELEIAARQLKPNERLILLDLARSLEKGQMCFSEWDQQS